MIKTLKYEALIKSLTLSIDCPGSHAVEYEGETFRWFRSDWDLRTNFLPNLEEPRPPRVIPDDSVGCALCAMSLYNSLEAAVSKFQNFPSNTRSKLGHTHVYKGSLEKSDGVASNHGANGHINFYEYQGVDICYKFVSVCELDVV